MRIIEEDIGVGEIISSCENMVVVYMMGDVPLSVLDKKSTMASSKERRTITQTIA